MANYIYIHVYFISAIVLLNILNNLFLTHIQIPHYFIAWLTSKTLEALETVLCDDRHGNYHIPAPAKIAAQ